MHCLGRYKGYGSSSSFDFSIRLPQLGKNLEFLDFKKLEFLEKNLSFLNSVKKISCVTII